MFIEKKERTKMPPPVVFPSSEFCCTDYEIQFPVLKKSAALADFALQHTLDICVI